MLYATPESTKAFIESFAPGSKTMVVNDMDGNVLIAYKLTDKARGLLKAVKEGHALEEKDQRLAGLLKLKPNENEVNQDIPSGSDIGLLLKEGLIQESIFADKPLDVRLPPELVYTINKRLEAGDPFSIAMLTSRAYEDVLYILQESGIERPKDVSVVSNSGNRINVGDRREEIVRPLNTDEQRFIDELGDVTHQLESAILTRLHEKGYKANQLPEHLLRAEHKGDAFNIHYRDLFQQAKPPLDPKNGAGKEIVALIKSTLAYYVGRPTAPVEHDRQGSPLSNEDGTPMRVFKLGAGPMTFEVKLANITKAQGMHEFLQTAAAAGQKPDKVIFTGDNCHEQTWDEKEKQYWEDDGPANHGTDWYAMMYTAGHAMPGLYGEKIQLPAGIETSVVHTLHPENDNMESMIPWARDAIPPQSPLYYANDNGIKIVNRLPKETAHMVSGIVNRVTLTPDFHDLQPGLTVSGAGAETVEVEKEKRQRGGRGGGG